MIDHPLQVLFDPVDAAGNRFWEKQTADNPNNQTDEKRADHHWQKKIEKIPRLDMKHLKGWGDFLIGEQVKNQPAQQKTDKQSSCGAKSIYTPGVPTPFLTN
ncbi:MAG: hypothetical protein IH613_03620 [Desulfuromonadales bacterium]|nr:hypothetical protein [Desulfuromonadales bacterium]